MSEVAMEQGWMKWSMAILGAFVLVGGAPDARAGSSGSNKGKGDLLFLVTERVEQPNKKQPKIGYWWSNPAAPQWTGTDRALEEALEKVDVEPMRPSGDVRISRIYRTPDLSLDNAASLASIIGARRIVVGEVVYRPTGTDILPGYEGLQVDARLRVVDVASSEPSVIRTLEVERAVFGAEQSAEPSMTANRVSELRQLAEQKLSSAVGGLLERTVAAAAGEVGIPSSEPLLAFRDLRYGRALRLVREFLTGLDTVSKTRVRWGSEGRIALEINPGKRDAPKNVDYAARTLLAHDFEQMTLERRRQTKTSKKNSRLEFGVKLSKGFEPSRRPVNQRETDE